MEFLPLIVPVLASIILFILFRKKAVWWELGLPVIIGLIFIFCFKGCVKQNLTKDTEYRGSLIVEARYYESWETWVHKTCSYTVSCGKNCTRTVYYDCSYCDESSAYWIAIDNNGYDYVISEAYYHKLRKRWNATPKFVELNRDIDYHRGFISSDCGKDGDMYSVRWDGQVLTSEPASYTHTYENKVQTANSTFKFPEITPQDAKKYGLYEYPELNGYKQQAILGINKLYKNTDTIHRYFNYLNGVLGYYYHSRIYVLMFYNQSLNTAFLQEAYWNGGNDNEVVTCIDVDPKTRKINWVKSFGWCDNKRVFVDIREDIMNDSIFNYKNVYYTIGPAIKKNYKPKDFKDFDYLEVELPKWAIKTLWIVITVLTIGISIFIIKNEIDSK